mgnify:FL=1|jgi:hypothetical protein
MLLRRGIVRLLIFVTIIMSIGFSQGENQSISGPLPGFTFVPEPGHLGLSVQYLTISSSSSFDKDGEEHDLNEYNERIGDPKYKRSVSALRIDYSVSKKVGLFAMAPFVNSQELAWNLEPTFTGALSDLNGQTGLGDVMVGGWFQISKTSEHSVHIVGAYTQPTGTSPDETTSAELSSTGSGHSATTVGMYVDFAASSKILLSLGGQYVVNQEATYTFDDYSVVAKYGNEIHMVSRLAYRMSENLSLGMDANYLSVEKFSLDGEIEDDSGSSGFVLTPMVGHHDTTNKLNMRINVGYQLTYAGTNILKYDGLRFGLSIIF